MRHPLAHRIAALILCLLAGIGACNALLADSILWPTGNIEAFTRIKRLQTVKHPDEEWTLLAAGDIMLSRFVAAVMSRESLSYPYDDIRGLVQSADIAFANLENPVGSGSRMPYDGMLFRADPHTLGALREAGFDVLSIANNHMSDAGRQNIGKTAEYLRDSGFLIAGAGTNESEARTPAVVEINGKKIFFLAYGDPRFGNQVHFADATHPGIAKAQLETMRADIERARSEADIIVLSLHAGIEYLEKPDKIHRQLLDDAVAAGADLVLGHHPHVIQPLEKIGDTWVIDSLGNLVFDQMWSDDVKRGITLLFRYSSDDISEIEAIPIYMHNFAQPRIISGKQAKKSLDRLQIDLSYATVVEWKGEEHVRVSDRAMPLQEPFAEAFTIERTINDNLRPNRVGERYILKDGQLRITEGSLALWVSPREWWVQDFSLADIDGDHTRDVILTVWKAGNYGSSKPFWVEENDASIKQHVFVYSFQDGKLVPMWQSSNLPQQNCETIFADLDGDGIDELIALDAEYTFDATCSASTIGIWKWENWGFYNQWKSEPGHYWNLRTEKYGSGAVVIANGTKR